MKNTTKELRVIIAGGRRFDDYQMLEKESSRIIQSLIEAYYDITEDDVYIVSGCAPGADTLGEQFAEEHRFSLVKFPANWVRFGKPAGYIRNANMAKFAAAGDNVGVLIAFWDGASRGTKNMIDIAENSGMNCFIIFYND